MKLFNSSVGRLVPSNLAFTEVESSQKKSFIEATLLFCEGKTNDTRICGMTVRVAKMEWLDRARGFTASVA